MTRMRDPYLAGWNDAIDNIVDKMEGVRRRIEQEPDPDGLISFSSDVYALAIKHMLLGKTPEPKE
jgi:hypothetical protein